MELEEGLEFPNPFQTLAQPRDHQMAHQTNFLTRDEGMNAAGERDKAKGTTGVESLVLAPGRFSLGLGMNPSRAVDPLARSI